MRRATVCGSAEWRNRGQSQRFPSVPPKVLRAFADGLGIGDVSFPKSVDRTDDCGGFAGRITDSTGVTGGKLVRASPMAEAAF